MGIDDDVARTYRDAVDTLGLVLMSPVATEAEKTTARTEIAALEHAWDKEVQKDFSQRTEQLNTLVNRLTAITDSIVTDPLQPVRDKINGVIEDAKSSLRDAA